MIEIDRLRMRLPPGFEHRATSIARRVGDMLAAEPVPRAVSLQAVSIEPQSVTGHTSDDEIARRIVVQIVRAYQGVD